MLGVIPAVNDQQKWVEKITEQRNRFNHLKDKVSNQNL